MSQKSLLCFPIRSGKKRFKEDASRLNRHDGQPVPPRRNNMVMRVTDERNDISHPR